MNTIFLEAKQICVLIAESFQKKRGVFVNLINAEDFTPNGLKREQAQFLFWVRQMDYAMKSERLYKKAREAWEKKSELFRAEFISKCQDKKLHGHIAKWFNPRYPSEIVKRFRLNAKKLLKEFDGQAINIVKQSSSANQLLKNIRSFRGFGPKLGNFLLRTYISLFKLQFNDIEDIFQPVDRHDVRLTYEWGLTDSLKMTQTNINKVKRIWHDACKKAGVSWINFDRALWILGSVGKRSGDPEKDFWENVQP